MRKYNNKINIMVFYMSSLNPIVGVSVCIGALGAGLAYLAWNNKDDENEETELYNEVDDVKQDFNKENEKIEETSQKVEQSSETENVKKNKSIPQEEIKQEPQEEIKQKPQEEIKQKPQEEKENKPKQSNMQRFLKETYDETTN